MYFKSRWDVLEWFMFLPGDDRLKGPRQRVLRLLCKRCSGRYITPECAANKFLPARRRRDAKASIRKDRGLCASETDLYGLP
jgi:hypothetical protein